MTTAKAWVAFLMSIITAVSAAFGDDVLNLNDVEQIIVSSVIALMTLLAVYQTPNAVKEKKES